MSTALTVFDFDPPRDQPLSAHDMLALIREIDPTAHPTYSLVNDFYLSTNIEIGGDGVLRSAGERGSTPAACIARTWEAWTHLPKGLRLVSDAYGPNRQEYVWGEHGWQRYLTPSFTHV